LLHSRQPHANQSREVTGFICGLSPLVNETSLFHFGKGQRLIEISPLVEHFIDVTIGNQPPVKTRIGIVRRSVAQNAGGAVGKDGPVPLGMVFQAVHLTQIVKQHLASIVHRHVETVEVDVLICTVVGTQTDEIPLVCHHVSQLELFEEALDRRVFLPNFLAGLNRDAEMTSVLETETHHGMGDVGRPPVDVEEIDTLQFAQVEGPVVVVDRVVSFGAVINVADIVDGDQVILDLGPGE